MPAAIKDIELPEIRLPEFERPSIDLKDVKLPKVDLSSIEMPKVDVGKAVMSAATSAGLVKQSRSRWPYLVGGRGRHRRRRLGAHERVRHPRTRDGCRDPGRPVGRRHARRSGPRAGRLHRRRDRAYRRRDLGLGRGGAVLDAVGLPRGPWRAQRIDERGRGHQRAAGDDDPALTNNVAGRARWRHDWRGPSGRAALACLMSCAS